MKTPRELLFSRHRSAEPGLDAIRQAVVAGLRHQKSQSQTWTTGFVAWLLQGSAPLWRELILPSRRIWTGLAVVWLLLLVINLSQHDPAGVVARQPLRSPAMMVGWQVQQRWMDELFADRSMVPEAIQPRIAPPRPRTEKQEMMAA